MNCYESQVRDKIKVSPIAAKAFWNEAKLHFDQGKDFEGAVKAMAQKSGLQEATIARVLTSDKRLKAITNDMWLKRARYGDITRAARSVVDQADTANWAKGAGKVWDTARQLAVIGHGGVFPFTHARNLFFSGSWKEMSSFLGAVKRAYSYATPKTGRARWAEDMAKMQLEPDYTSWARMGLDIKPGSEPLGILTKGTKGWGQRGFDALKPTRLELARRLSEGLPDDLRTEETGRILAREVNYATGSIDLGPKATKIAGNFMFAPQVMVCETYGSIFPATVLDQRW